ncbi:helix-turn-helix domain-containing protein [Streptomyces sp. NPDC054796]
MNWSAQAIRNASGAGDYGRVVRLARNAAGVSQGQLGEACGISQSAVSRLEGHGDASYDMTQLAKAAAYLQIPPALVGLADHAAALAAQLDGTDVERRNFLTGAAAVAASPAIGAFPAARASAMESDHASALKLATTAFRRLDGSTPSRQLTEPVLAHLRLTQTLAGEAEDQEHRTLLAAAGSEAASFAGWLAWDMGDNGSARTWYGSAVNAARRSGNTLLEAYQLGSLGQFEASTGNPAQGLGLVGFARRRLGERQPTVVAAWLATVEALAHAAARDRQSADAALVEASRHADRLSAEQPPPWPWVFPFDSGKVDACRLSCGALLGIPGWVLDGQAATKALSSGHEKQRALRTLDVAMAHMAAGRLDGAFALASRAVETGLRFRSGRILEKARAMRRNFPVTNPPKVVRDFDERLHAVYL